MSRNTTKQIGDAAESQAKTYLQNQGLVWVCNNYRCKMGEIDLVMREGETWVFVEVKFRSAIQHGSPEEFFTSVKQRKVLNAVRHFLLDNNLNEFDTPIRIDVVALYGDTLEWFKNVTG